MSKLRYEQEFADDLAMARNDDDSYQFSFFIEGADEMVLELPRGKKLESIGIEDLPGVPVHISNYEDLAQVVWYVVKGGFRSGDKIVVEWELPCGVQRMVTICAY